MDRLERVNSLLKRELAILLEEKLGDNFGMITVVAVSANRDLSHAKVYLESAPNLKLGGAKAILEKNQGELRRNLGKKLDLKKIPYFEFIFLEDAYKN